MRGTAGSLPERDRSRRVMLGAWSRPVRAWAARLAMATALTGAPWAASGSDAVALPPAPASAAAADTPLLVYVRDGCPHCAEAKDFLTRLQAERPGLRIVLRPVDTDARARDELSAISEAAGLWPPGVPTFVFGERVLLGFDDAEHSGRALRALVDGGSAGPAPEGVDSDLFGPLSASRLGLPLFTLALGLLDGFNPCAMWVLLFLRSLLVRLRDRRRMALIAGTFVAVSGAVYCAFMAAWLNVFLAVGFSNAVRLGLALLALAIGAVNLKDFVAPGRGLPLSIPASARPGLLARMHRLRQARTLPALYTAVLAQQDLAPAAHHVYLGLYILGYIADDGLMVGLAVAALGSGTLGERGGRWLKLLSGAVMLALGAALLLRPEWLLGAG